MKPSFSTAVVGVALLALGLTGCNGERYPAYSPGIKYGLRQDPIVKSNKFQELNPDRKDRDDPDRPGLFPVMKLDDMLKPDHPYHAQSSTIIEKLASDADWILRDPMRIPAEHRKALEAELDAVFGTPAKPKVDVKALGIDESAVKDLMLDDKKLEEGSSYYRVHCLHCHGVPGNGRGPTARWVNPHPRDFRSGIFKFQSSDRATRGLDWMPPSRADLMRTLRQGLEGTAMPSFVILPDNELEALVSYVMHLSIRGRVEKLVMEGIFEPNPKDKGNLMLGADDNGPFDIKKELKGYAAKVIVRGWIEANKPDSAIVVAKYPFDENAPNFLTEVLPASVKRGQQIFNAELSEELKQHYVTFHLDRNMAAKKKAAVDAAIADAEAKLFEEKEPKALKALSAEVMAIKAAQEKAAKEKLKLSEDDLAKIKEDVKEEIRTKLKKDIAAAVEKDAAKFEAAVAKDVAQLEKDVRKALYEEGKNTLSGSKCVTCHIDYGRRSQFLFDEWGTLTRPNNLTLGVLRGGKRPVDIYYRMHSGIPGTRMIAFGSSFKGSEPYMWDVINFVTVLPYPEMRKSLGVKID